MRKILDLFNTADILQLEDLMDLASNTKLLDALVEIYDIVYMETLRAMNVMLQNVTQHMDEVCSLSSFTTTMKKYAKDICGHETSSEKFKDGQCVLTCPASFVTVYSAAVTGYIRNYLPVGFTFDGRLISELILLDEFKFFSSLVKDAKVGIPELEKAMSHMVSASCKQTRNALRSIRSHTNINNLVSRTVLAKIFVNMRVMKENARLRAMEMINKDSPYFKRATDTNSPPHNPSMSQYLLRASYLGMIYNVQKNHLHNSENTEDKMDLQISAAIMDIGKELITSTALRIALSSNLSMSVVEVTTTRVHVVLKTKLEEIERNFDIIALKLNELESGANDYLFTDNISNHIAETLRVYKNVVINSEYGSIDDYVWIVKKNLNLYIPKRGYFSQNTAEAVISHVKIAMEDIHKHGRIYNDEIRLGDVRETIITKADRKQYVVFKLTSLKNGGTQRG